MERSRNIGAVALVIIVALATAGQADMVPPHVGQLNSEWGGIFCGIDPCPWPVLGWEVSPVGDHWHYKYVLTVADDPAPSDVIFEVSGSFTEADAFNVTGATDVAVQTFTGSDNPGLPESFRGIKFSGLAPDPTGAVTIEFDSGHPPGWGDFYAKGVSGPSIYNSGFATDDPTDPLRDGPWYGHLLVPVPAPAAFLLGMLGLGTAGIRLRKLA